MDVMHILIVVMPLIDPQGLTVPCFLEPTLLVEIDRSAIGNHYLLVNSLVPLLHTPDDLAPDSATLVVWVHCQMGIVHHQVPIRDGVTEPDQPLAIPGRDDCAGMSETFLQFLGLLG